MQASNKEQKYGNLAYFKLSVYSYTTFLVWLFCNIILVGLINEVALQYKFICCSFIDEIYLEEGYFAVKDFKLWTSNKAYLQFLFVFTVMSCVIIAKFICIVTYYTSYTPYLHIFTKLYGSVPRY
jgi:hypothetical protein